MLRPRAASKKKNDRINGSKICDCLRCEFLPECYMAPTAIGERRRHRNEAGYFRELLATSPDIVVLHRQLSAQHFRH